MDPTANLTEQREIAARLQHYCSHGPTQHTEPFSPGQAQYAYGVTHFLADAERLAELVVALDEWLQKGGALPEPWDRDPPVTFFAPQVYQDDED